MDTMFIEFVDGANATFRSNNRRNSLPLDGFALSQARALNVAHLSVRLSGC